MRQPDWLLRAAAGERSGPEGVPSEHCRVPARFRGTATGERSGLHGVPRVCPRLIAYQPVAPGSSPAPGNSAQTRSTVSMTAPSSLPVTLTWPSLRPGRGALS